MTLSCVFPIASLAASFVGRSLVLALAVSPQATADPGAPTAKEQALMEHACRTTQKAAAAQDAYEQCLAARLQSLRADFGTDLGKLSASARGKIDAACSQAQASLGREGYVECLSAQLASLTGRAHATRAAPAGPILSPQGAVAPSAALVMSAPQESSAVSVKSATLVLTAVGGVTVFGVVIALVVFAVKSKRVRHVCRVCSEVLPGTGDLCAPCRHDAAEPLRRAASERAERQRAEEAEQRLQEEHADQQRQDLLRQEEGERLRRLEDQGRLEEEERRREADARQAEAVARQQFEAPPPTVSAAPSDDADSVFDPYRGLGLTSDASQDEVRAAYDAARMKYDPDLVEHLGFDVKEHYAEKFRTAERAYQMIAGTSAETASAPAQ
jgi:hypothetical protein